MTDTLASRAESLRGRTLLALGSTAPGRAVLGATEELWEQLARHAGCDPALCTAAFALARAVQDAAPGGPGFRIDTAERRAWLGDRELDLTPVEHQLMTLLAERPGRLVTFEAVGDAIWQGMAVRNNVCMLVSRLRAKLGDPALIASVRGYGYRLECAAEVVTGA